MSEQDLRHLVLVADPAIVEDSVPDQVFDLIMLVGLG